AREEAEVRRDFVGYGDTPPKFVWPDGSGLAVTFVINYEEGAELNPLDGDPRPESFSEGEYPTREGERLLLSESVFEYGSRTGVWRMLKLFDEFDVPVSVFAAALALERNPLVTEAFCKRNYDMNGHGYRWITHQDLTEEEEREQ